ncbi:glutamyl-tRNA synthetase [Sphingobium wenxiniae]|uniref:Glutamate--tRNA ligase n=2 Tax=Sphingobium TaxID=165695 RepID=T0GHX4_9SPHN|nr:MULTISPECIES: glutamate--tRNA ligase [Sphingobium]EQB00297.1 glutamyl-tRNA synthetase [Sphingobium baderi LL03]KMS61841.1 glutamyl-tRNA synthetase [Sphingobium baderi LL03]MBB6190972.1 glutamyl-tRNA synthetase [Sphingobium wenxiniae]TWH93722.1 glutamyl-tRNA synthetase [Sphingobium wenxiniae]
MTVITRFAPSPTGHLHVGNIRAALHNWLWARKSGGKFLLRLDDTDLERSRPEYADAIRADLQWLGLAWDHEARQSDRFALYEEQFEALKASGHVYPAYETSQELELRRKVLLGRGLPPVYDRAALSLTAEEIAAHEAEGRKPHWRFKLDHEQPIVWTDLIRGEQRFDPKLLSDPVIRRADGSWLYMLPSVIDDIAMGVTHVLRGEDHVSNTATQIQMFAALRAPLPAFAHEALLTGSEGKLSKRLGSLGVAHFREMGLEPMAVLSLLARLGSSVAIEPFADVRPLIDSFDFAHFGRAPARFDEGELASLNQKIVHMLPYAAVAGRLPDGMGEAAWDAIRPNLETVAQAADWWRIVTGPFDAPEPAAEDRDFLSAAHRLLADIPFDGGEWRALTDALKAEMGRKGKALFLPLRRALTGMDHGPDMAGMLSLIGKDAALARLSSRA